MSMFDSPNIKLEKFKTAYSKNYMRVAVYLKYN